MSQNNLTRKQKIEILKAAQRGDRTFLIDALNASGELVVYMDLGNDHYFKGKEAISKEQYQREMNRNTLSVTLQLVGGPVPPITSEKEAIALYESEKAAPTITSE